MRVLMLSHMYPNSVSRLGGIFVRQQAAALARLQVELTVVAPIPWVPGFLAGRGKWGGYPAVPFQEQPDGFTVYHPRVLEFPHSWLFEYSPRFYARGLRQVFDEQLAMGVDLIHAHVAHPDGAAALQFGRRHRIPVVVTVHGQDFAYTLQRSRRCAESVRTTLREAAGVILVSEKLKIHYDLESWADDLTKYRVIYNGVDLNEVVQRAERWEDLDHVRQDSRKVLLSLGFLRPDKGHAVVLKALPELIREFPDLEYRIVGEGTERQALRDLTGQLGLERYVRFLDNLSRREVMLEMGACDVFVLPSVNEAFGVVYLEAMANGKPIIGTLGEGIAEILTKEPVGKAVPPKDVPALAEAIRELLKNPRQAKKMGARGKELVESRFTWDANALRTLQFYEEIVGLR